MRISPTEYSVLPAPTGLQSRRPGPQTLLIKLVAPTLRQHIDEPSVEAIGSDGQQLAMPTYLNNRAWTIFGRSYAVQRNIIAKNGLGL
jgi:hypothetical protein